MFREISEISYNLIIRRYTYNGCKKGNDDIKYNSIIIIVPFNVTIQCYVTNKCRNAYAIFDS